MIILLNTISFLLLTSDLHSILEAELVATSLFSIFFMTQDGTKSTRVFYLAVFEKPLKHTYMNLWALLGSMLKELADILRPL